MENMLVAIDNEYPGRNYKVEIFTEELTALCPFSGNPDYYKIRIVYVPDKKVVELKSLKYYFVGFRNERTTHEALLNKIFEDLKNVISPKYLKIELFVNIRGGIEVTVSREEGETLEEVD